MKSAFERAHKAQFGFIDRKKALVIEAVSVEAVGGGATFREKARKTTRAKLPRAGAAHAVLLRRQMASRAGLYARHARARPQGRPGDHHRAASDRGGRARLAGRADGQGSSGAAAGAKARARAGDRHPRRSGDARSVQQSVHVDRRADGRRAAEHRLFGEHQGAARFLLRGVRRRTARWSPTRRTCRCISARWTAPSRPSFARTRARIRPGDVYVLNAPYNGGTHLPDITVFTPVFDTRAEEFCSGWPRAAITPTSAASRRARCRRSPPRSTRKASRSTISSWSIAANSASGAVRPADRRANIRRAIRCRTSTTSRRRSPPTRRACRRCAGWCASSALHGRARLYAPRPGQCRRKRAPRDRPAARRRVSLSRPTRAT